MVSTLAGTIERIKAEKAEELAQNPPPDTEAIFLAAQKRAAIDRLFTIPPLTPEAAATPAVVIEPHPVSVRTDLTRLIQPVVIRGH